MRKDCWIYIYIYKLLNLMSNNRTNYVENMNFFIFITIYI